MILGYSSMCLGVAIGLFLTSQGSPVVKWIVAILLMLTSLSMFQIVSSIKDQYERLDSKDLHKEKSLESKDDKEYAFTIEFRRMGSLTTPLKVMRNFEGIDSFSIDYISDVYDKNQDVFKFILRLNIANATTLISKLFLMTSDEYGIWGLSVTFPSADEDSPYIFSEHTKPPFVEL
jgi:hypothetical protein